MLLSDRFRTLSLYTTTVDRAFSILHNAQFQSHSHVFAQSKRVAVACRLKAVAAVPILAKSDTDHTHIDSCKSENIGLVSWLPAILALKTSIPG